MLSQPPRARQHLHNQARGITLFTSGGLGGGLYDELMTHLSGSTVDIAVTQESKWSECMEYTGGSWTCIHSGCKTRQQAGVLVLLHHSARANWL